MAVTEEMLPDEAVTGALADFFAAFGDSTRIRILSALAVEETCVTDLAEVLKMTPSAISHQLKILKTGRLVKARREGKQIYYSLDDDHVRSVIAQGMEHILE